MIGWLLMSLLIGCGGFAMALFAASDTPSSPDSWRQLTWIVAVVAALINIGVQMINYGEQGYYILPRDIVAVALLGIALTHLVGRVVAYLVRREYGPTFRTTYSIFIAIIVSLPAPFIGLMVHCTSGDCL